MCTVARIEATPLLRILKFEGPSPHQLVYGCGLFDAGCIILNQADSTTSGHCIHGFLKRNSGILSFRFEDAEKFLATKTSRHSSMLLQLFFSLPSTIISPGEFSPFTLVTTLAASSGYFVNYRLSRQREFAYGLP